MQSFPLTLFRWVKSGLARQPLGLNAMTPATLSSPLLGAPAQDKHLSGFLSPAPASCLHSQGSSWVDYQLYRHPIQDPLKSCLTISGSKENGCSGPILYLLGTNVNPQRASRFATGGYSSCSLLPSEISTFAGTYLCDFSPPLYHRILTLLASCGNNSRWKLSSGPVRYC